MLQNRFHLLALIFPFLSVNNLVDPFKRNKENINRFRDSLDKVIEKSTDHDSISSRISSLAQIPKNFFINDIVSFIIGGTETSAHLITSCVYLLNKNKQKLQKLLDELESFGIKKFTNIDSLITKENIQNMDYLNYVVKEALRLDGPIYESLDYAAKQDTEICGVPIPKDTIVRADFSTRLLNSSDWKQPFEFIPERFDPSSDEFSNSKSRMQYSYTPFSHGIRSCPGQIFALLQTKIILIYLLTQTKYSLDEEMMQKESVGFGIYSDQDLGFTVGN